ncbi:MAG: aminotransferase class V-fold PLP-dependent enzyme [Oscillospiraceae bacterium]|nr:aminotransferase class V-fold PLP-dependent enzyme [Oscillospiraceae bacterium]
MIYLDHGATSFPKPQAVIRAASRALQSCANPGRGGYRQAMQAAETVYRTRERAAAFFGCKPEQAVFTPGCTYGLNAAIATLVAPGDKVAISGFEHNAVTRPLHSLGAQIQVCGRDLFCWDSLLEDLEKALKNGAKTAVFTHVSNVFGYILPIEDIAALCRRYSAGLIIDAAQSAGILPLDLASLGADFIAIPGHKGLLGPQGVGLLLCAKPPKPLVMGGTGSESENQAMPELLPERMEAGSLNVAGIAALGEGIAQISRLGRENIRVREEKLARLCAHGLRELGLQVYAGAHQGGTVSFRGAFDCEELATALAEQGAAVRAGLHCAPLAHQSAGTLETGTVRISFGHSSHMRHLTGLLEALKRCLPKMSARS